MVVKKGSEETSMDLEGDREIVIARTFDAPARVVFDAWTKPELVRRWWAPKSHRVSMAVCEADVSVGGAYRYVLGRDAEALAFSGTYREVTPHSRLVYSQIFEPMRAAGEVMETITFEEAAGKTRLVSRSVYPSKAVRDAVLASGMEGGMRETMEQLAALVVDLPM